MFDDFVALMATDEPLSPRRFKTLADIEAEVIKKAVVFNKGNLARTAKQLGIGRATLYNKMERYGITR